MEANGSGKQRRERQSEMNEAEINGTRPRMRFLVGLVALFVVAVGLGACGGDDDSSDSGASGSGDTQAAVEAAQPLVDEATAEVTDWTGPTQGPTAEPGKKVVGIMSLGTDVGPVKWCQGAEQAANEIGWDFTVLDGKGSPSGWQSAIEQAIAQNPDGILLCSIDAEQMKSTIEKGVDQGITFVGVHSTALPGPAPELGLFTNVSGDGRDIGRKSGAYAVVASDGEARVVALGDKSYAISRIKSGNTLEEVGKCSTCEALKDDSLPVGDAPQRTPDRFTSYLEEYDTDPPLWIYSVTDFYLDSGVPALRGGAVPPEGEVSMIGSDGSAAAYDRIRNNQYQVATVPEPLFEEGWVMIDELVRAFADEKPSGYSPPVHIIDAENIDRDVTEDDVYEPHNDYRERYSELWESGKTSSP
jgi:ribose transport system substrate-binding protein